MRRFSVGAALLVIISFFIYYFIQNYSSKTDEQIVNTIIPSSSTSYDINLNMKELGVFQVSADILITNESQESWADVAFYFVPNAMNPEVTAGYSGEPADVEITTITSGDNELIYELDGSGLFIEVETELPQASSKLLRLNTHLLFQMTVHGWREWKTIFTWPIGIRCLLNMTVAGKSMTMIPKGNPMKQVMAIIGSLINCQTIT